MRNAHEAFRSFLRNLEVANFIKEEVALRPARQPMALGGNSATMSTALTQPDTFSSFYLILDTLTGGLRVTSLLLSPVRYQVVVPATAIISNKDAMAADGRGAAQDGNANDGERLTFSGQSATGQARQHVGNNYNST